MSELDRHLRVELEALDRRGLLRAPIALDPSMLVLCANDYLGYANDALPVADAAGGAGASRLISGDHRAHREAEQSLAAWLGHESALLMSSGYATNVGVIAALASESDVIVSDAANHASIIDGCKLSRARVVVVPHLDVDAVEQALHDARDARCRWLITESYFSMDGDVADLARLRTLADRHRAALIVDEAHALGIFGERGRGLCAAAGVMPDVLVGTLGKALGLGGAFVCGSKLLRSFLWNRARSFVFSTGVTPWLAAQVPVRVNRVSADDAARERLATIVSRVRADLADLGAPILPSVGPIVPWLVGDDTAAVRLRDTLLSHGVFCQAIRPPTVPPNTARLRITLHARLHDEEIAAALAAFASCLERPASKPR